MHPMARAGLAAVLVFWALASLFFVQPFTGAFLLVAIPAAVVAMLVFVAVRSRPPAADVDGSGPSGGALVIGVALILLGVMFAVGRWPMLWDPCHTWDD